MIKHVAYIGNFTAPWCTEVHLARDLRALGVDVTEFQQPSVPGTEFVFLQRLEQFTMENAVDAVMFTRTWPMIEQATALWRRLEARGIITFSYHLDLYVGLKREETLLNDPFWTTQFVFTPDGDPHSAEVFAGMGINHHWLSPAVVSDECVEGTLRDEFAGIDVAFVGSYGYHPEWPWRTQLIDYLAARYGPRFKRFGGDVPGGPVRGQRLNDLYATVPVIVGDSLNLPGHTRYWTDRYFETIGRGGFLIAPHIDGLEMFLSPQVHYVPYQHPHQLDVGIGDTEVLTATALSRVGDLVDYYLEHEEDRERIRRVGHEHVATRHTYRHRLGDALRIMEGAPTVLAPPVGAPTNTTGSLDLVGAEFVQRNALGEVVFVKMHDPIERLELGSGFHPTPGFTHLDINPDAPDVDIVGTAWPLNLRTGSVGEIRAVDVLEHLSYWDTPAILADWFRVLRPGGKIYIQVPDAEAIMEWFVVSPGRLVERLPANLPQTPLAGAAWRLLGGHHDGVYVNDDDDFRWNAHYALFSHSSLMKALMAAGFVDIDIQTNPHPNLLCNARKP